MAVTPALPRPPSLDGRLTGITTAGLTSGSASPTAGIFARASAESPLVQSRQQRGPTPPPPFSALRLQLEGLQDSYQQPRGRGEPGFHPHASLPHNTDSRWLREVCELLATRQGTILEFRQGSSHTLALHREDPDSDTSPCALLKLQERELGTDFDQAVTNNARITSKQGIEPGEGAFREHLAMLCIRQFLRDAGVPPDTIDVPDTEYGTFASDQLYRPDVSGNSPYLVEESGVLIKFESNCATCKAATAALFRELPPPLVHLLAILDIILLNADRNGGNLMIQQREGGAPRLLLIDHAAILPAEGQSAGSFVWLEWNQLKEPLDAATASFIAELSPATLEGILSQLRELGSERAEAFHPKSLHAHRLAIAVLQEGLRQGLSLYEIAILFAKTSPLHESQNIIAHLCRCEETSIPAWIALYKENIAQHHTEAPLKEVCIQAKHTLIPY